MLPVKVRRAESRLGFGMLPTTLCAARKSSRRRAAESTTGSLRESFAAQFKDYIKGDAVDWYGILKKING